MIHRAPLHLRMVLLPGSDETQIKGFLELRTYVDFRAGLDDESDEEDNESAYVELVEYVRVAAQLCYEELADLRYSRTESQ